ncbi:carbohydrate-binding protein [Labilibacter sediminis]|nr:carbohydrate-binding protein [Labilibacter sediminis]
MKQAFKFKKMKQASLIIGLLITVLASCTKEEDGEKPYVPKTPVEQSRSEKRGVAFNYQFVEDVTTLASGISWSYNWGHSQGVIFDDVTTEHQIDFCPMAWNGVNEDMLREYVSRHPECEYLLAFNEPNLTDQANMTPQQAAEKWPQVKEIADELNLKIISPAMNYGTLPNYSDPIVWLDEFFTLIPIDDIEGISVHCYMPNATALKGFIERFEKYNKPIWLTEFCAWEGHVTPESQQQYMSDALNYLESSSNVYRYAWFIPRSGSGPDAFPYMPLLKNTYPVELTDLGMIYTQMSSQDKSIYYVEQQQIEAEHYSSISIAESANETGWTNGPKVRVTTDAPNENLELYNFYANQWVEYQIEADRSRNYNLEIRYATFIDAEIEISIDGELVKTISLGNTTQNYIWNTAIFSLPLSNGKQTLRLKLTDGACCINWLKFL